MDKNKKKLLLGSALAGIMVAGPGLAVTAGSTNTQNGKFFQTAELSVGYRLAQAAEGEAKKAAEGEKKAEGDHKHGDKKAAEGKCGEGKCGEGKCGDKKKDANGESGDKKSEKKDGAKGCGAGSCGSK